MTSVIISSVMSGFVKLHQTMLRSTTWKARPERDIFITALLMAEPREVREPVAQLRVDALEPTGWQVPPGWYGWCDTSGIGIIDEADVDRVEGIEALRRLGEPEPASRSQAFDGRRLVRVDGGYIVLNYDKYREKDTTCAERARRYRERKSRVTSRDITLQGRSVTQAEAEAEAEAEKREREPEPVAAPAAPKQRAKAPGKTKAPEELEPTEATLAVARETGRNWRRDWVACRDWAWGKGELKSDWQATLRGWMRRSAETTGGKRHEPPQPNNLEQPYKLNIV